MEMPAKAELARYSLTDAEQIFVIGLFNGGTLRESAIKSGAAPHTAHNVAHSMMRRAHVLAAIHSEARRALIATVPASLRTLEHLRDKAQSEKVRESAARTLLDRAGLIAPRASADKNTADVELHEMSLTDLRSLADKLQDEIAGRAKDVSSTVTQATDAQASDLLG